MKEPYFMDFVFRFFLIFIQGWMVAATIVLGSIVWNRKTFFEASCLLLTSLLLNTALKTMFNIPLPVELGITGLAFPSGHMQSALVFYGWIGFHSSKTWIKGMLAQSKKSKRVDLVSGMCQCFLSF